MLPATRPAASGQNMSGPRPPSISGSRSSRPAWPAARLWLNAAAPDRRPIHLASSPAARPPARTPAIAGGPFLRTARAYPAAPDTSPPATVSSVNQPSAAMNALVSGFNMSAEPEQGRARNDPGDREEGRGHALGRAGPPAGRPLPGRSGLKRDLFGSGHTARQITGTVRGRGGRGGG